MAFVLIANFFFVHQRQRFTEHLEHFGLGAERVTYQHKSVPHNHHLISLMACKFRFWHTSLMFE
ncbi:hypothetical protein BpHYR1_026640 [Brachionus plicatilis]|uniref:Uncharacterized protein n=1 Tax=Brachionus plicatilis TaxID=10195 RepID=A0A3M7RMG3_BRAPC|nr:hypothetical protein BpHYR1_026640 [Brachionus plicatilis]